MKSFNEWLTENDFMDDGQFYYNQGTYAEDMNALMAIAAKGEELIRQIERLEIAKRHPAYSTIVKKWTMFLSQMSQEAEEMHQKFGGYRRAV